MKIGDLVRYIAPTGLERPLTRRTSGSLGVVVMAIRGTAGFCKVIWNDGGWSALEEKYLEIVNEDW